jgi:hypothetical protein
MNSVKEIALAYNIETLTHSILYEAVQSLRWQKPFKIFCNSIITKAEVSTLAVGLPLS